jgi:hypothetical protein
MENLQPGSNAFIQQAANRALSNSNLGRIVIKDRNEGARFSQTLAWENNFNAGNYLGTKTFNMNPGDDFAFMLVQNTTVQEIAYNPNNIWQWGKMTIFSIPEANPGGQSINQMAAEMVDVDGNGTYAMEDIRVNGGQSDRDYNDLVFQVKGASGNLPKVEGALNNERNWTTTNMGQNLLAYTNRGVFDRGIFVVGQSGNVNLDVLYDGGELYGELGIFSLSGMESLAIGSKAFNEEAIRRSLSNSLQGRVVFQDEIDGARFIDDLPWEGNYNEGIYRGEQTLAFTPGDIVGLVFAPNGNLNDYLINPNLPASQEPFFSMSDQNIGKSKQLGEFFAENGRTIVGFEDVNLEKGSNRDYNDLVVAIEGVNGINLPSLDSMVHSDRNWLNLPIGETIVNVLTTQENII